MTASRRTLETGWGQPGKPRAPGLSIHQDGIGRHCRLPSITSSRAPGMAMDLARWSCSGLRITRSLLLFLLISLILFCLVSIAGAQPLPPPRLIILCGNNDALQDDPKHMFFFANLFQKRSQPN
jgi:hypothetical protein